MACTLGGSIRVPNTRGYNISRSCQMTSETGHRPNIPGYQGCTLWQGVYAPAHTTKIINAQSTTSTVHKSVPISPNNSNHKRDSQMSKMVTTVPPCNPFNQINKLEEVLESKAQ